jgi:Zn-dependent protease with chaperone function
MQDTALRIDTGTGQAELCEAGTDCILAVSPLQDLRIDSAPGSAARRVSLPDGWLFESDDPAVETLIRRAPGDRWLRAAERLHPRLILFALGALGGVWLIWRYGLDLMVAAAVALTPPVLPNMMDAGTLQTLDATLAEPTSLTTEEQARYAAMFDRLLPALPEPGGDDYTLVFRDLPGMGPNAFSMPGGTIVLTDQMVRDFGKHPDMIAAVLGHEIGHVAEQHGLRQVYRSLSVYALVSLMAGDVGPILEDALLEGQVLLSLSYSRRHELAADAFGLELSAAAGFDPAAMKTFFETIAPMDAGADWYSTHPLSAERLDRIDAWLSARR